MYDVGIIGAGKIACGYDAPDSKNMLSHAHAISDSNIFNLRCIFDINRSIGENAAKKWNTESVGSIEEMEGLCDVICCAAPDEVHYEVLKKIQGNKRLKAVICEKPLTTSLDSAEEVVEYFEQMEVPIIVNYSRRFMSGFQKAKEKITSLGRLVLGNCYYGKGMFHNCSHMINMLDYLIDLSGYNVTDILEMNYDFWDNDPSVEFIVEHNGSRIFFHVIPCSVTTVFQTVLFFEYGKLIYDDAAGEIVLFGIKESDMFSGYTNYFYDSKYPAERNEALPNLYTEVQNVIDKKTMSISDGRSALETLRKCQIISDCSVRTRE